MSKDLGKSTSYAYYVDAGGTKTPQEYGEMLVNIDTVATRAEDAADSAAESATGALNSKNAAQTAATTATNKATEATTAATTATNKAAEAQADADAAALDASQALSAASTATTKATEATTAAATAVSAKNDAVSANTAAQSAKTAAQTAQTGAETAAASVQSSAEQIATNAEDISQLKSDFADMESDGVVPSAEQILSDKGVTDSAPYHYRKTGGDGADRLYDQIVGGTVCFNQFANNGAPPTDRNGITFTNDGNSFTMNGTSEGVSAAGWFRIANSAHFSEHVVLTEIRLISGSVTGGNSAVRFAAVAANNDVCQLNSPQIVKYGNLTASYRSSFAVDSGCVCDNAKCRVQVFDLTQMFGTTFADYIYSLETAHTGDGVALFKSLFPNDYYEYNGGELVSVSGLSEHKMVGFNQWDEKWEVGTINVEGNKTNSTSNIRSKNYIPCFPNTSYYGNFPTVTGVSSLFFYDGDGNFLTKTSFPQKFAFVTPESAKFMRFAIGASYGTTYNHDICINLSDPAKNGTYEPYKAHSYPLDSTVELRGILKLDSNNKLYFDGDVYEYTGKVTRNTILRAYQSGDESLANAITDGTNTVVYSANASTEQADPYQHLQQCDPNGTEEYVSTGIVPVGHNSFYPENLRAKVEGLPWNFASLIAPTESAFVATRNYTTGALFIVDNVLYKATSNIANGGAITPNTNCTATTLAEIISALA